MTKVFIPHFIMIIGNLKGLKWIIKKNKNLERVKREYDNVKIDKEVKERKIVEIYEQIIRVRFHDPTCQKLLSLLIY